MKYLILTLLISIGMVVNAQSALDTIRLVSYNVNNYGDYDVQNCPTQTPVVKNLYLRTILKYANPDIIGLVKMEASSEKFYTDTLPAQILDSVCNGCWGYGAYTDKSGYYKENMLYFNSNKFGIVNTSVIYSGDPEISDIDLYKLYYKSSDLSATHDTIYLNIILVHDESGSSDSSERAKNIGGAMSWLDSHVIQPGNYIIIGDFNVQDATEQSYQDMINPSNNNVKFYDPVNEIGNWSEHPSLYAYYLTQSTRITDPGDCGATGGMNNRFDQILCTSPVINGTDSIAYVDSSYIIIGQDGNHVDEAINAQPTNFSVPSNILTALYQMSEHLPVMLKLAIGSGTTTNTLNIKMESYTMEYNSVVTDYLLTAPLKDISSSSGPCLFSIYDLQGKLISSASFNSAQSNKFYLSYLSSGMYIFSVTQNLYPLFTGRFVKM